MLRIGIITSGHDWFGHPLWHVSETVTTVVVYCLIQQTSRETVPIDSQAIRGNSVFIEIA